MVVVYITGYNMEQSVSDWWKWKVKSCDLIDFILEDRIDQWNMLEIIEFL